MARIRTNNQGNQNTPSRKRVHIRRRKHRPPNQGKSRVECEITNPKNGLLMGYWYGTEEQLMGSGCPCPGGAILPGCCDLHDF